MDKVSVIIPTYNRQDTLPRAVRSALEQTYPVFEIVVCDDGSTDGSEKIIREMNDPRVHWLDCGRSGRPSVPRNKGIRKSSGEWIALLDSDDEWLPVKIETQLGRLKDTGMKACSSNAYRMINGVNSGTYLFSRVTTIPFSSLLKINTIICSSVLAHRNLFYEISFFPEEEKYKAIEDFALWLRITTRENFIYAEEPLLNYYDDPSSSVRSNYTDVWQLRKVVLDGLSEWISEKNIQLDKGTRMEIENYSLEAAHGGRVPIWNKIIRKLKM